MHRMQGTIPFNISFNANKKQQKNKQPEKIILRYL